MACIKAFDQAVLGVINKPPGNNERAKLSTPQEGLACLRFY
jgi:hypothetical protein